MVNLVRSGMRGKISVTFTVVMVERQRKGDVMNGHRGATEVKSTRESQNDGG